jgi:hypothetical protein
MWRLEQMKGIEPSSSGWEPEALPLSYTCRVADDNCILFTNTVITERPQVGF